MNIILFGPPGAGKGTQADNIVKSFNLHKVSTGDLLRDETSRKTKLGSKIIFIEALKKVDLKISDIFVIFYYDIFDISKSPLSNLNIKLHSLCTWKNILNIIRKKKLYNSQEISSLESFLKNPSKWRAGL